MLIRTKTDLYDIEDAFDINHINLAIDIPKEDSPHKYSIQERESNQQLHSKIKRDSNRDNFNLISPKLTHEESGNINDIQQNLNPGSGMVMLNSNRLAMLL